MKPLDDLVCETIQRLFPGATIPDEESYLESGDQYKAPDHEVFGGSVLIERKSLNAVDGGRLYDKLLEVATKQGRPFIGWGTFSSAGIVENLPDPETAKREITDYMLNQLKKDIRKARKKFAEHAENKSGRQYTRILIVSDQSSFRASTDSVEHFIGRLFVRNRIDQRLTGLIDGILYIKYPQLVWKSGDNHWFKCVINRDASNQDVVKQVSNSIYERLRLRYFWAEDRKFTRCPYRHSFA